MTKKTQEQKIDKEKQHIKETKDISKEEQIGFHKGALSTLAKEREELMRILQIVEQLMNVHVKELNNLGVDLEAVAREAQKKGEEKKRVKPIEDMLR